MLINFEIPSDPSLCKSLDAFSSAPLRLCFAANCCFGFLRLPFVFHMFGIILLSSGNARPGGRYWLQSRTGKTSSCIWGREPFRTQSLFFLKCIREINTLPITCYIFTFRVAGFSLPNLCEGMCIFFLRPFCSVVKYSPPGLLKDFTSQ